MDPTAGLPEFALEAETRGKRLCRIELSCTKVASSTMVVIAFDAPK